MRFGFREFVFLLVLLAVPTASAVYVFKPRNDEIRQARQEIEVQQTHLHRLEKLPQHIDDIRLLIEEGQHSIEVIETKLPTKRGVDDILKQVWQLAERNKQTVKSVKPQPAVPAALYMELPIKVEMEGHFKGFYQFLLELEALPRITKIRALNLRRGGFAESAGGRRGRGGTASKTSDPNVMRTEFQLSIFYESQN